MREGIDYDLTYLSNCFMACCSASIGHGPSSMGGMPSKSTTCKPILKLLLPGPCSWKIPKGCELPGCNPKDWVLHVKRNIYGGKDSGPSLVPSIFKPSLSPLASKFLLMMNVVFYKGHAIYVLYTDDSILVGPDQQELDDILLEVKSTGLDITSEDGIDDFLGVTIDHKNDGTIHMTQKRLIQSILEDLGLNSERTKTPKTPMLSAKLLSRHPDSPDFDQSFQLPKSHRQTAVPREVHTTRLALCGSPVCSILPYPQEGARRGSQAHWTLPKGNPRQGAS